MRAALLVCAALALAGCGGSGAQQTTSTASTSTSTGRPALWIGDSYTAGTGADSTATGEAYATSEGLGWHPVRLDAEGGTGFVNNGDTVRPNYKSIPARLPYDIQLDPDPSVIVVDAGRNDLVFPERRIRRAVVSYFRKLSRAFPSAPVVVIAPFLMRSKPGDYAALRRLLGRQARHYGWAFVDPLALGWINKTSAKLVAPDGIHPDQAGYDYLVEHLGPAITNALTAAHETVRQ